MQTQYNIKIGHNVTKGFILPDSPLQVRYCARAISKIEEQGWELMGTAETLTGEGISARKISIINKEGSIRHILGYNVKATSNKPFVLFVDDDNKLQWSKRPSGSTVRLPNKLADDKMHQMFTVTYVDDKGNNSVSSQCYDTMYMGLIARQSAVGVPLESPRFVNPLSIIPSLAIVAMLLSNVEIGIRTSFVKEARETLDIYMKDEVLALEGKTPAERIEILAPDAD